MKAPIPLLTAMALTGCSLAGQHRNEDFTVTSVNLAPVDLGFAEVTVQSGQARQIELKNCSPYLEMVILDDGTQIRPRFGPTCVLLPRLVSLSAAPTVLKIPELPNYHNALYVFEIIYGASADSKIMTKEFKAYRK
ncbi:hypothetical protein E5F05_09430 [Deinococcus metallilatus]|uniref:Lipoprotein n=1 Tax=Deinococcus metallilatus TaxID=1211322 RepID=A0AAJ5F3W7_9DEIO|nr:hypothetical protein [Deinococcus metallilatus]MBB5296040.1 hypothetical protein [Deinococcus metallilatus]QBY08147.1 hypothetical protein E5F05_09430 [Deinococcus metallilatus]RXJ11879.1 hypothetical protein ERJ73_08240 [Deinococcus metallilatus]TLK25889.1 hypothetical protein FCS05_12740 [Deinococcus metallilatus]GMA14423.1 hypothetical protein GCM10025871_07540 [Deinococcus metallilatus]